MKKYSLLVLYIVLYVVPMCNYSNEVGRRNNPQEEISHVILDDSLGETKVSEISWDLSQNLLIGKVKLKGDTLFAPLKEEYSSRLIYLLKPVARRFEEMCQDAKKDSVILRAISGMRTFDQQRIIWERKWSVLRLTPQERIRSILSYSSMPMTSRHHWGTDVDINNLENAYFEKGRGRKEYQWLLNNAHKYGFVQVYGDKKNGRTGYELERWHWSYMPIARCYLEEYIKKVELKDITGFSGSETATALDVIKQYVCGIDTLSINTLE